MELLLETLAKIGFMFALIMGMVVVLIWAERKGAAFIQDRTGPNRAAIGGVRLAGLIHPIADVLKLFFKMTNTSGNSRRDAAHDISRFRNAFLFSNRFEYT